MSKQDVKKRERPVVGSNVAKCLLYTLREMRERSAHPSTQYVRETEEIERWEDIIREQVKEGRKTPREILQLDGETTAALNEAWGPYGRLPMSDGAMEFRRRFALRAIKETCAAWINGERPCNWTVDLREKTDDELRYDATAAQAELYASDPSSSGQADGPTTRGGVTCNRNRS